MNVYSTADFSMKSQTSSGPILYEDVVDSKGNLIFTIYTLKNYLEDHEVVEFDESGFTIKLGSDNFYDIIVNEPKLSIELVKAALPSLTSVTGTEYVFNGGYLWPPEFFSSEDWTE